MERDKISLKASLLALLLALTLILSGCSAAQGISYDGIYMDESDIPQAQTDEDIPYKVLNDNVPEFTEEDLARDVFESYSDLDSLGRCGQAFALLGEETMPTEDRQSIGQIRPSGWQTVRYDDLIQDKYLYNRCHLIGYQLSGENANEKNLITGTRYMNVQGMLPFENQVADYIEETGNHVLYRVSPIYEGDELVARGVKMEALSVEDSGAGICFNVFVYNIQPGITIDYATGDSHRTGEDVPYEASGDQTQAAGQVSGEQSGSSVQSQQTQEYILNINTMKFHLPDCYSVKNMKEENKEVFKGARDYLISEGFEPCGNCNP